MKKRIVCTVSVIFALAVVLNLLAWNSRSFCDFYVMHIFPLILGTYGRITSLFQISVGEMMIAILILLLATAIIFGFVAIIFFTAKKKKAQRCQLTNKEKKHYHFLKKVTCGFYKGLLVLAANVFLLMTLNCFILYHCSTFEEKYMSELLTDKKEYTIEELAELRDYVVMKTNEYARMMDRDERGIIQYDGDMPQEAIESMRSLGDTYPQLAGYYPTPKKITSSAFISQQYMQGYYFPFSMEANYNDVMYVMCQPSTMCHELAHTKGFIYEDEANLIGFLACVNSDDVVFQYSGYLSVLNYIDNDFKESIQENPEIYNTHVKISSQVKLDNVFLTQDAWAEVETKAVVSTKTVKTVSRKMVNTSLVLNGIEQGSANYSEVVGLLMDYYSNQADEVIQGEEYIVRNDS